MSQRYRRQLLLRRRYVREVGHVYGNSLQGWFLSGGYEGTGEHLDAHCHHFERRFV